MKKYVKLYGFEILYLLILIAVGVGTSLLQFVGKKFIGEYSGLIFSGTRYSYNPIFYGMGMVLFLGLGFLIYRILLGKQMKELKSFGIGWRILFGLIGCIFAFGMFVVFIFEAFAVMGLGDDIGPDFLFVITFFGWPIISAVFMVVMTIVNSIQKK